MVLQDRTGSCSFGLRGSDRQRPTRPFDVQIRASDEPRSHLSDDCCGSDRDLLRLWLRPSQAKAGYLAPGCCANQKGATARPESHSLPWKSCFTSSALRLWAKDMSGVLGPNLLGLGTYPLHPRHAIGLARKL
jgi:hypothetical protein